MIKLTKGQITALILTAVPLVAIGGAGGYGTFVNMLAVLHSTGSALGIVAAGEGATLAAALVQLSLTLLGRHTPNVVRAALWLVPMTASVVGVMAASDGVHRVTMAVTPLAMTVAGEGIALVARSVVAVQTGVDLEQQRRAGQLMWHAQRTQNGGWYGRHASRIAVWRLSKKFAETDPQMAVQLGEVQRYRIAEGADAALAAALSGSRPVKAPQSLPAALPAALAAPAPLAAPEPVLSLPEPVDAAGLDGEDNWDFISGVLAEAEQHAADEPGPVLLTADEVAQRLNVTPGTVRSWKSRGKLVARGKDEKGRVLFDEADLAKLA